MKTLKMRMNTGTDHYDVDFGPEILRYDPRPVYGCKCLVKLPPYRCWCRKGFWDPDECMIHAVQEHGGDNAVHNAKAED